MDKQRASSIALKGLTGAVALAGANQTYGQVVAATAPATPSLVVTEAGNTTTESFVNTAFDVDGDGSADFELEVSISPTGLTGLRRPVEYAHIYGFGGVGSAAVVGYVKTFTSGSANYASKLTLGTTIGPASTFVGTPTYYTNLGFKYNTKSYGKFTTGTGYIGFEFTAADGLLHYGYLDVATTLTGTSNTNASATLTYLGGFYQATAGAPITIGGAAVPEPSSLAALAFGAAGLLGAAAYRRKGADVKLAA
jgi:hypothetical protein